MISTAFPRLTVVYKAWSFLILDSVDPGSAHHVNFGIYSRRCADSFLFLHSSPTLAVVQRTLLHGLYGVPALVLRLGFSQHAEVTGSPGHTLSHGSVLSAAAVLRQTLFVSPNTVQPNRPRLWDRICLWEVHKICAGNIQRYRCEWIKQNVWHIVTTIF